MSDEKARSPKPAAPRPDEVIRIEDLAPREDVKGGRKIVLGEVSGEHDDQVKGGGKTSTQDLHFPGE